MTEREVRCLTCNHEWVSKAAKPRCSRCDSRNVEDVKIEATPPPPSPSPQSGTDYSKVFTAFDEGKNLIDVIKQGLCNPDRAEDLWNKYEEFKNKVLKIEGRPLLEARVEELAQKVEEFGEYLEVLSDLSNRGEEIKEKCDYYGDGFCYEISWNEEPKGDFVLESIEEDGRWFIDPSVKYCALCPMNTNSHPGLEGDLGNLKSTIRNLRTDMSDLKRGVKSLEFKFSVFRSNICPNCRQPALALLKRCRSCGAYWEKSL